MKIFYSIKLLMPVFLLLPFSSRSQESENVYFKNNIKVNTFSFLVKNYVVSYERMLSPDLSLQGSFRYGPYDYVVNNIVGRKLVKRGAGDPKYYGFKVSNTSTTIDLRWYPGKKPGLTGFFAGIYGRYTTADADNTDFNFVTDDNRVYNIPLIANLEGYAGGIVFGRQWIILKRISIESSTGIHLGRWNGTLISNKDLSGFSEKNRQDFSDYLYEMATIFQKQYLTELTITDDGVRGQLRGPFFGLRSSLTIGLVF